VEATLGLALADLGRDEEAVECYRLAAEDSRRRFGSTHKAAQSLLYTYAEVLRRTGHWEPAIELLRKNLELVRSVRPGDSPAAAMAMVACGTMQVDHRQKEGIAVALEGLARAQRVGGLTGFSFDSDGALRGSLLGSLGSWNYEPDGRLPAQIFCALDEMFRNAQPRLFDFTAATPSDVHYLLQEWSNSGTRERKEGTLQGLAADREPTGLYSLTTEVAGRGKSPIRETQWVLFAPWDVSFYES